MRMTARTGWTVASVLLVFTLVGCDVDQTEQARMPDVDVDVDPGKWPQYDVDWADVDVGTTERTIEVPVVAIETETRQVSVPYLDIKPAGATDFEERTISVELDVPHAGYQLQIEEIRAAGDDLWVIARLTETGGAAQAVSRVSDHVVANVPDDLDVRKIIIGQQPSGVYNRQHRFVDSTTTLEQMLPQGARVIYRRSG